jgi:glycosyltransferase involved in cell wall biosynthesis
MVPFVSCLCPTYRRPRLLANALACFLAQDYPPERRELVILDDGGDFAEQSGPSWRLVSTPRRFDALPEKFNTLADLAQGDWLVVWEDDDIYLPWHLSAHAQALNDGDWSKPSRVLSLYTGKLAEEAGENRFHASLAFTRDALIRAGGWPNTKRADFDYQLVLRLSQAGRRADPCAAFPASYVFRWQSTQDYHAQTKMRGRDDEGWYERCTQSPSQVQWNGGRLTPAMDEETRQVIESCRGLVGFDDMT